MDELKRLLISVDGQLVALRKEIELLRETVIMMSSVLSGIVKLAVIEEEKNKHG